jgi:hypothetical protein
VLSQPPTSFKSFAVEDRPGEQWVRLRAAHRGTEEIKIDATLFDGAAEPGPDAPLFNRVEALEQGPRLHLSLIVEVARADRVLGFICSAWPDDLAVRHVLTLRGAGAAAGDRSGRDFAYGPIIQCFLALLLWFLWSLNFVFWRRGAGSWSLRRGRR